MESIFVDGTFDILREIQNKCLHEPDFVVDEWPDGCDDCSSGSCSGGCSYLGD